MTYKQLTVLWYLTYWALRSGIWMVAGCSQVLSKSVCESRWKMTPPSVGVICLIVFQFSTSLARVVSVSVTELETGCYTFDLLGLALARSHLEHIGHGDELYSNHMPVGLLM